MKERDVPVFRLFVFWVFRYIAHLIDIAQVLLEAELVCLDVRLNDGQHAFVQCVDYLVQQALVVWHARHVKQSSVKLQCEVHVKTQAPGSRAAPSSRFTLILYALNICVAVEAVHHWIHLWMHVKLLSSIHSIDVNSRRIKSICTAGAITQRKGLCLH